MKFGLLRGGGGAGQGVFMPAKVPQDAGGGGRGEHTTQKKKKRAGAESKKNGGWGFYGCAAKPARHR